MRSVDGRSGAGEATPILAGTCPPEEPAANLFVSFAHRVSSASGKPATFVLACLGILIWAVSGPFFGYSETWQLVVNTATTIITFLMVFVLQNTQNRDGAAVQAKLDELIFALREADNRFVGAERLSDTELKQLRDMLVRQAETAQAVLEKRDGEAAEDGAVRDGEPV